jgi:signal peptidase I
MSAPGHDDPPGAAQPPEPIQPVHTPATTTTYRPPTMPKDKGQTPFWKELPVLILIAFGLALLIKSFLIQAFYIPSESMVPTLEVGDRVLVNKVVTRLREPKRGEIIVFVGERNTAPRSFLRRLRDTLTSGLGGTSSPETDFIKRVIGLPGETVLVQDGKVTITPADGGMPFTLKEPYIAKQKDTTPFGPFQVPKGSFFVMGDNRPNSSDSRGSLGPIKRSDILGRAFVRIWPIKRFKGLSRPKYAMAAPFVAIGLVETTRVRRRRRNAA